MSAAPSPYDIRPLTRQDAAAWRDLRLEMLTNDPGAFTLDLEDAQARTDEEWVAAIPEGGPNATFGLFIDSRLVGSAGFYVETGIKRAHRGMMWGVYVGPSARGRGLGEALVRAVIDHAREHVAVLHTSGSDAGAPLYRKCGFVPIGLNRDALRVDGVSYDEEFQVIHFDPRP